jgi:MoaA/NifB/PqqE/SkfB family radical SAM enzyme
MTSKERIFRGSPHYYERVRGISLGENELDFLSLNVPPRCNYRCAFCLSGMGKKQKIQNPLTRRELYGIIIQAKNLGAFHVEISGEGEPLLYRRMLENIETCNPWEFAKFTISSNILL